MIDGIVWLIPKDTKLTDIDIPKMGRPANEESKQEG